MIDIKKHSLYKTMEFDDILSNVYNVYRKNFWKLFLFCFLGVFLFQFLSYQLGFSQFQGVSDPNEMYDILMSLRGKIGILIVLNFSIYGLLNVFIVNFLIKKEFDSKLHFGNLLIDTVKKYWIHAVFFMFLSGLMVVLGMIFGVIAFIVGMFLALIYLLVVVTPGITIIVAEAKNAIEAIGRCFILVHKDFWKSVGVCVVCFLVVILLSLILTGITSASYVFSLLSETNNSESLMEAMQQAGGVGWGTIIINSIFSIIIYPIFPILSFVMYFNLRHKEDSLQEVV
ncbi:MAG: hypothetical protein MI739_05085 [Bacteroidales bacterium]|nr:hypothetical protein [Bacteroidales bacterium]